MTMIEVTTLYCPQNQWGGQPGEDNTTHHLLPRAKGMVCRDCGKTEKELREQEVAERARRRDDEQFLAVQYVGETPQAARARQRRERSS